MSEVLHAAELALGQDRKTSSAQVDELGRKDIEQLVTDWFSRTKRELIEATSADAPGYTEPEDAEAVRMDTLAELEERLQRTAGLGNAEEADARRVVHQILIERGFAAQPRRAGRKGGIVLHSSPLAQVDEGSADFRHMLARVQQAQHQLLQLHRWLLGERQTVPPTGNLPAQGLTLDELIEGFVSDGRRATTTKRRTDYEMVFRLLREVIGGATPVQELRRADFRRVDQLVRAIPKHATKIYPGLSFADAARRADSEGRQKLSPKSLATHLQKVSTLFRWAENEGHVERNWANGLADPGSGVHSEDDRRSFSSEDLAKIFSEEPFVGLHDDRGPYETPRTSRDARFWVPLISLYHGMRLNEICQLRTDQLKEVAGVWHFEISSWDASQKLKTSHSRRRVPLHPVLLSLGFVDHVGQLTETRMFPDLPRDSRGYHSRKITRWFSDFLARCGVGLDRKSFHSFRHTWRDAAREARIPDEVAKVLGGWARSETSSKYGDGHSLQLLSEEIKKINFPNVPTHALRKR